MSGVNVTISVNNLVQMDRLQTDAHRGPMVNQEQNAEAARQDAMRRVVAPAQPDGVEGKKIDPEAKRDEQARKRRGKRRGASPEVSPEAKDRGRIVDFSA
jgi:hypothetical protein